MGSTRQDNTQQQQGAPTFSGGDVAMQNDLFGDMMKAQAENRQKQLAMRMNRIGQMGYGGNLLGGMQQQMPWQGLLQALAQMQAQQQAQQQAPQQQPDSVWNSPFTSQGGTG
jgi:hypothetical protein